MGGGLLRVLVGVARLLGGGLLVAVGGALLRRGALAERGRLFLVLGPGGCGHRRAALRVGGGRRCRRGGFLTGTGPHRLVAVVSRRSALGGLVAFLLRRRRHRRRRRRLGGRRLLRRRGCGGRRRRRGRRNSGRRCLASWDGRGRGRGHGSDVAQLGEPDDAVDSVGVLAGHDAWARLSHSQRGAATLVVVGAAVTAGGVPYRADAAARGSDPRAPAWAASCLCGWRTWRRPPSEGRCRALAGRTSAPLARSAPTDDNARSQQLSLLDTPRTGGCEAICGAPPRWQTPPNRSAAPCCPAAPHQPPFSGVLRRTCRGRGGGCFARKGSTMAGAYRRCRPRGWCGWRVRGQAACAAGPRPLPSFAARSPAAPRRRRRKPGRTPARACSTHATSQNNHSEPNATQPSRSQPPRLDALASARRAAAASRRTYHRGRHAVGRRVHGRALHGRGGEAVRRRRRRARLHG
eukprot:scaffold2213_cov444-Prasinococcus_capsulatus_cf.AAC.1